MRHVVAAIAALILTAAFFGAAHAFEYSPLGLAFNVGGGVKWAHSGSGDLQFQNRPYINGSLGKEFSAKWYGDVTLERTAVQEADYQIRAEIHYRVGRGSENY